MRATTTMKSNRGAMRIALVARRKSPPRHRLEGRSSPAPRRGPTPLQAHRGFFVTDWKNVAADALNAPSWKEAAKQYHRDRAGRPLIVEIEPEHLKRLRRLMDPATSLERAWDEIGRKNGGAPQATVEALMFSLRSRGTKAVEESATKRRLFDLSEQQVIEIGNRLQRLKPEIARAWSAAEVEILLQARIKCPIL